VLAALPPPALCADGYVTTHMVATMLVERFPEPLGIGHIKILECSPFRLLTVGT
jgi:hypothetical protein